MNRFKRFSIVKFLLFLFISTIFISCYKDRFDMDLLEEHGEWNPDVAAPAIYSNLTFKDILNDYDDNNLFVEDGSHFLYLVYWNKVYSRSAAEIFSFAPQNVNTSFSFSVTGTLPYGLDVAAPPYTTDYAFFTPNNIIVDEIDLDSGRFNFIVNSPDLNHNATINVSIPSATLNGVPFSENIDFIAGSSMNSFFDLSGYKILFDNSGATKNVLHITYTVTVHGSGGANNSPYQLNLNESFTDLSFSKILGDFKQINFDLPNDSIKIRMNNNNIHGFIDFENPMIHVYATNSFGMPIRINITDFHSTSGWNAPYDVVVTGIPVPWDINAPSVAQMGDSVTTEFHLTKANSNVWDAIAIAPQWFVADIAGISNPTGAPASNFALADSRFDIDAKVELPLHGKAWDLIIGDTLDFDLGEDIDVAEYIDFRINTTNGFPVDATLQLYFMDKFNNVLDSMLTPQQQVINAALAGGAPDYLVYQSSHKLTTSRFEKSRLTNLKNTEKVFVKAIMATPQNGNQIVKFYSFYGLEVRVGVRAKFNVIY
ncbi:MAG TPA: hypothetical protein PKI01_01705 [Bacteroidales bacterium]|nr:hypothetical protein [Bacteroidales bacterium]